MPWKSRDNETFNTEAVEAANRQVENMTSFFAGLADAPLALPRAASDRQQDNEPFPLGSLDLRAIVPVIVDSQALNAMLQQGAELEDTTFN